MRYLKRWTAVVLSVVLALSMGIADVAYAATGLPVMFGADPTLTDRDYDGIPDEFDAAPDSNVFTGRLKSGHDGTTAVTFTMDYRCFFGDNTTYYPDLAGVSVMGSALAYYAADYSNAYFTFDTPQTWSGGTASRVEGAQLMRVLGFEDVVDYTLDSYGDDDLCEVLLGHRTVTYEGRTLLIVAIWVRGTNSTSAEEWSSNFHMGDLVRFFDEYDSAAGKSPRQRNDDWTRKTNHRGFDVCATRLMRYLKTYYLDEYVKPALDAAPEATLTYWLTGHSRGAAVANLMGSYLVDEGARVFDYTFAAPYNTANTEASAEKYDCIFNLVNSNDFIPMLPMTEWGFTRYGKTASVDASQYASDIKAATGSDYSGNYLTASDMSTLLGKFICITGENASRTDPGRILGWREVYVYHCGHDHAGETCGAKQSTTFCPKQSLTNWGGPTESSYNGYAVRLRKYSYWHDGICETPAYDLQVLVELLVAVAKGETLGGASTFITSNKLAEKFDFDKWSLIPFATKLTEPHFMDTYSVVQAKIGASEDPGVLFHTLPYYTVSGADGGRPAHTHEYSYQAYTGREPTCTEDGLGERWCLCSGVNADYYDDYQKNVVLPALGHAYEEVVTAPTCTEQGYTTHTCSRCGESYVDSYVDALGHDWGEPVWTWTEDFTASAEFTCRHDESHVQTVTAVVTAEIGADGSSVYTATVDFEGRNYTDTRTVTAAGHQIIVTDYTNDGIVTDIVADQLYSGQVTFNVSAKDACLVAVKNADGSYTALKCANIDGEHRFTVTVADVDVSIAVACRGDANLDGTVNVKDATLVKQVYLMLNIFGRDEALQTLLADTNGDGRINTKDATFIKQAYLGLATLEW